jgi:hypothetical protein
MNNKIVSPAEAAAIVRFGDTVSVAGFVGIGTPDELLIAIERRFLETGEPCDLTLVFAAAPGDGKDRGLNRLAHPGLVRRAIGGHWALVPKVAQLAMDNAIEAYNLPLGCIAQLYCDIAARRAGLLLVAGFRLCRSGENVNDRLRTLKRLAPVGIARGVAQGTPRAAARLTKTTKKLTGCGDRRRTGGQAASAVSGDVSLAGWNFCPKSEPNAPL